MIFFSRFLFHIFLCEHGQEFKKVYECDTSFVNFFQAQFVQKWCFWFYYKKYTSLSLCLFEHRGGGSSRRLENSLLYEKYLEKNFFSAATLGICALNPDTYKFVIKSGLNEKMGTLDFFFWKPMLIWNSTLYNLFFSFIIIVIEITTCVVRVRVIL